MHTRTKVMRDSAMFCTSVATKLVYSYKKTLVVVSHDRGFLNEVTTDIIHLHDEALHYYKGNHASFEDMYEQRRRAANKEFEKFTKNMKNAAVCAHTPALMLWRCRLFTRADCGLMFTLQTQCLFHGSCLTHCNIYGSELTSGVFAMHSISYATYQTQCQGTLYARRHDNRKPVEGDTYAMTHCHKCLSPLDLLALIAKLLTPLAVCYMPWTGVLWCLRM
jgi:hypothetical protein